MNKNIQSISKQQGLTMISILAIVVVVVFFVIFLIRLVPIYLDGFAITESLSYMETQQELKKKSIRDIRKSLMSKLNLNSVYGVVADDVYIIKKRNKVFIEVDYEVRENIVGNLDFVVSFNKEAVIQ